MRRGMVFGAAVLVALGGGAVSWIAAQSSDPSGLSCPDGELRQTTFLHWSADFEGNATAREAVEDQAQRLLHRQRGDRAIPLESGRSWEVRRGDRQVAIIEVEETAGGRYLVEEVTTCSGDAKSR